MAWYNSGDFDFGPESTNQKVSINQLSTELSQTIIFGVVIGKQDIRCISSKNKPGSKLYVLNFTIRDSPSDAINAACWGEEVAVRDISSNFAIGDTVQIKNAQIIQRQADSADEKYRPPVNSVCQLNISPIYSEVMVSNAEDTLNYENLLHCPMHAPSNYLILADVIYNSQNVEGLSVNLLVAVKEMGTLQHMTTKDGKQLKKLQLSVFDQSHHAFPVLIWEEETANFVLKHCSRKCVLLISDVKVSFNSYMKEMVATATSSTIFTPEPEIPDGRVLYQYAQTISMPTNINNGNDPKTVYTVKQIVQLMRSSEMGLEDIQGIVCAYISSFDIDGESKVSTLRCPGCMQQLKKTEDRCTNGNCDVGSGMKMQLPEEMFDVTISISDETGCLPKCLLSAHVTQNMLKCNVQEFSNLSDEDKTTYKWKYLLERFFIQFKIPQASGSPVVRIYSVEKALPS